MASDRRSTIWSAGADVIIRALSASSLDVYAAYDWNTGAGRQCRPYAQATVASQGSMWTGWSARTARVSGDNANVRRTSARAASVASARRPALTINAGASHQK